MLNSLTKKKIADSGAFFSMLIAFSCVYGFVYEVIFYYFEGGMKNFYWRGGCFGPFIMIYGIGGVVAYLVMNRFKARPIAVFLGTTVLLSSFELIAGAFLYYFCNGHRGWDYNIERWNIGNIGGFICLRSAVVWGISGLILVYIVAPLINKISQKLNRRTFLILAYALLAIILVDNVYNLLLVKQFKSLISAEQFYGRFGILVHKY